MPQQTPSDLQHRSAVHVHMKYRHTSSVSCSRSWRCLNGTILEWESEERFSEYTYRVDTGFFLKLLADQTYEHVTVADDIP